MSRYSKLTSILYAFSYFVCCQVDMFNLDLSRSCKEINLYSKLLSLKKGTFLWIQQIKQILNCSQNEFLFVPLDFAFQTWANNVKTCGHGRLHR